MISSLIRNNRQHGEAAARACGATQRIFEVDERAAPVDFAAWTHDRTLVLFIRGTKNLTQTVNFLSNPIATYIDAIGAYVARWVVPHYEFISDKCSEYNVPFGDYDRIVLVGHSLGGAVAYFASRMIRARGFAGEINVFTFGEPKCMSHTDTRGPSSHVRIVTVASSALVGYRPDPIAPLPFLWVWPPLHQPSHDSNARYYTVDGASIPEDAVTFIGSADLAAIAATMGDSWFTLHTIDTSYLPIALARYTRTGDQSLRTIAAMARPVLNLPQQAPQRGNPMFDKDVIRRAIIEAFRLGELDGAFPGDAAARRDTLLAWLNASATITAFVTRLESAEISQAILRQDRTLRNLFPAAHARIQRAITDTLRNALILNNDATLAQVVQRVQSIDEYFLVLIGQINNLNTHSRVVDARLDAHSLDLLALRGRPVSQEFQAEVRALIAQLRTVEPVLNGAAELLQRALDRALQGGPAVIPPGTPGSLRAVPPIDIPINPGVQPRALSQRILDIQRQYEYPQRQLPPRAPVQRLRGRNFIAPRAVPATGTPLQLTPLQRDVMPPPSDNPQIMPPPDDAPFMPPPVD